MKNTNQSMIITIEDPGEDKRNERRIIRINGVRFCKRGISRKPEYDVRWLAPTFVSRRPWGFNVPIAAIGKSIKNDEDVSRKIPEVIWNHAIAGCNKTYKARSIGKAICLTKRATFADGLGTKLVGNIEDLNGIRRMPMPGLQP